MENLINTAVNTTANSTELLNKVYDDTVHPAAKNVGQALGTLSSTLNVLLAPVSWAVYGFEIIDKKVKLSLNEKLNDTPLEELTEPNANIAIPAYEALRYSLDNEELKNMYVNLIASSMQKSKKDLAHPAFVEIVKQLSSFDAIFLKTMFFNQPSILPKIKVRIQVSQHNLYGVDFYRCILSKKYCPNGSLIDSYLFSIDNLERLKILTVDDISTMQPDNIYDEIIERVNKNDLINLREDLNYVNIIKGSISLTDFGKQFISIVF